MLGILLILAGGPPDSLSPVVDDLPPRRGWTTSWRTGAFAQAGTQDWNGTSDFVRTFAPPGRTALRSGAEAEWGTVRGWDSDESQATARLSFAPLLDLARTDSGGIHRRTEFVLREGWVRLERSGDRTWFFEAGRRDIEPGAGLASHPSRVLPAAPQRDDERDGPLSRNPVYAGAGSNSDGGWRTSLQWFPSLDPSGAWTSLAAGQSSTVRLAQTVPVPGPNALSLEAGAGDFTSVGASWEWRDGDWFASAEGAVRNDGHPTGPRRDRTGAWSLEPARTDFSPALALCLQRDFEIPALGRWRLSGEWSRFEGAWDPATTRSVAALLDSLSATTRSDPRQPAARGALGTFVSGTDAFQAYRDRFLARIGSVESMGWGGGLNLLALGPLEGAWLELEAHATLPGGIAIEGRVSGMAWTAEHSLARQAPVSMLAELRLTWSIGSSDPH